MADALKEILETPKARELIRTVADAHHLPISVFDHAGVVLLSSGTEGASEKRAPANPIRTRPISRWGSEVGVVAVCAGDQRPAEADALAAVVAVSLEGMLDAEFQLESLSEEIVERYEEVNLLYDLSKELGALFDEDEISSRALGSAAGIIDVESASLLSYDKEGGVFCVSAVGGSDPGVNLGFEASADSGVLGEVARQKKPLLASAPEALSERVRDEESIFPTGSLLAVPLLHSPDSPEETLLGLLVLCNKKDGPFTTGDQKLISAIASQASTAIYNARLVEELKEATRMKRDLELATEIQESLLPQEAPVIPGAEIAGRCVTAVNVGGDYYDYITCDDGAISILLGDVTGHSLGAALMMTAARATLLTIASESDDPGEVIQRTNTLLYSDLDASDLMISLFVGRYLYDERKLLYANGGHNPPYLLRGGKEDTESLDATGVILGVEPEMGYDVVTYTLSPGDLVFFYTDGVVEAQGEKGKQFGEERLAVVLRKNRDRPAEAILDAVYESVRRHTNDARPKDDITAVVLKIL